LALQTRIYCGKNFLEELKVLENIKSSCEIVGIEVPQEAKQRLEDIYNGVGEVPVSYELEVSEDESAKRYKVKVEDIISTDKEYLYIEFSKESQEDLTNLKLDERKRGFLSRIFSLDESDLEELL